jgi:solute carrier family 25 (mitochondrial folate transporter), member 32
VLCTILCAPLDVVKVRLQIQGSLHVHKYHGGVLSILRSIYSEEGIRGIFRGMGPALCTIPLFWGVYWPVYDYSKIYLADNYADEVGEVQKHLYSAVFAGIVSDVITNPFWVTRTRIQTLILHPEEHLINSVPPVHMPHNHNHNVTVSNVVCRTASAVKHATTRLAESSTLNHSVYTSITTFQMMTRIYRTEGVLAFYKGLAASFLGLSHVAIQFPLCKYFFVVVGVSLVVLIDGCLMPWTVCRLISQMNT